MFFFEASESGAQNYDGVLAARAVGRLGAVGFADVETRRRRRMPRVFFCDTLCHTYTRGVRRPTALAAICAPLSDASIDT